MDAQRTLRYYELGDSAGRCHEPACIVFLLSFFFRDGLDTGLRTRKHLKKTNLNAPVYELHGLPCADVLYVILYWKDDLILRTQQRPDDFWFWRAIWYCERIFRSNDQKTFDFEERSDIAKRVFEATTRKNAFTLYIIVRVWWKT